MDKEREAEELTEELELMKSVNNLADQANRKMQSALEESHTKIESLEVIKSGALS
jgi:hypothetical protein